MEQQTATAEILRIINGSTGHLTPVFDAILQKARRLAASPAALCSSTNGDSTGSPCIGITEAFAESLRQGGSPRDQALQERRLPADALYRSPIFRRSTILWHRRPQNWTISGLTLFIPLRKGSRLLGQIVAARKEVRLFSEKEIEILESFASQAVIAIENSRLLAELHERSAELARSVEELTTLQEVGQAVSSTLDLTKVLTTLVTRAVSLAGADAGAIYRYRKGDRQFQLGKSPASMKPSPRQIRGDRSGSLRPPH